MFLSSEIPPAERITSATQANNANKEPHTTTEQIEISEYSRQRLNKLQIMSDASRVHWKSWRGEEQEEQGQLGSRWDNLQRYITTFLFQIPNTPNVQ